MTWHVIGSVAGPAARFSALLQRGEPSTGTSSEHARPGRRRSVATGHRRCSDDGGRSVGDVHHHRSATGWDQLHQGGQHHSEQLRPWPRHPGRRSRGFAASSPRVDRTPGRVVPGVRHRHLQRRTDVRPGTVRRHLPSRDSAPQHRRAAGHGGLAFARRHPERVVDHERMDQASPHSRRCRGRISLRLRRRLQRGLAHPGPTHRSRPPASSERLRRVVLRLHALFEQHDREQRSIPSSSQITYRSTPSRSTPTGRRRTIGTAGNGIHRCSLLRPRSSTGRVPMASM